MSPPNTWGPPSWTFFHTIAEKIKEESFQVIGIELFFYIRRICSALPCPECSLHATQFLGKIDPKTLKTKLDLVKTLYIFHNVVNKRKSKSLFNSSLLQEYKNKNLIHTYNHFVSIYKTKGNMKLLTDSFQRTIIIGEFKKWLVKNFQHFEK